MNKIIEKANSLIEKNEPFEYWILLKESSEQIMLIEENIDGEIEDFVAVQGIFSLGKNSVVKNGTRIEGNVFIGKNCTIGPNAFLRNGTIIADNCHIGTSEVKNSIILSGSKVPHFSYVGDSVIGRNCNLGAGTKIANLRHDNANVKVFLSGKTIDSGTRKLGALLFDNVKTGVNSAINCGCILPKGSLVMPCEFRQK
ncbi:MAG: hypothetical protein COV47_05225 [Candidatus Diapherotrites archaeon CG11_big_fil_rev_8_21_14_0_20_37_9]|nr:MAG: hypothetical protein COV47_05225 [Candidatus Diapherotrites archaeon CG11_big_fil_rev_8_21_14_0_20_37_9]